jgi:hypothetical protein
MGIDLPIPMAPETRPRRRAATTLSRIFADAVTTLYAERAVASSARGAKTGAVTVVQRIRALSPSEHGVVVAIAGLQRVGTDSTNLDGDHEVVG